MMILPSASMFSFVLSKFLLKSLKGLISTFKNLQGAFLSIAPGSLWEVSFKMQGVFESCTDIDILMFGTSWSRKMVLGNI